MATRFHRVTGVRLFFIPVTTRLPLKFGTETLTSVTCFRVAMSMVDERNRRAEGWGETPLSVQWVWPSSISYEARHQAMQEFCRELAAAWMRAKIEGHALETGFDFQEHDLPDCLQRFNQRYAPIAGPSQASHAKLRSGPLSEPMPWLAALVCNSAFDLALHDAFGQLADRPVYETYGPSHLNRDLAGYLQPAQAGPLSFAARYPADYLCHPAPSQLLAWHLVGGLDLLEPAESPEAQINDGHPILLGDWIRRDGLKCLKIKLRGNDAEWDYRRLVKVSELSLPLGVEWLTADFNCTVKEVQYVNEVLDRLQSEHPKTYERLLYVEQPFPYDLERNRIDVHSVSARKPLFLDESAHDWRMIRLGRELGWTGVALKTCKTQTGAILSACWARAHGMDLMVQDLTNPMLAQIPHLLLAANIGTIMGVETNSMQFYPEASASEAKVHPGMYQRRQGMVDLSSVRGPGFGYRLEEIRRVLPEPALVL
jgi:L-alanine-DL-glutamate epimerase-like enolase superfamily enzyme